MNTMHQAEEFDTVVRQLTAKYLVLWRELPDVAPEFSRRFTPWQQRENERQLEIHLKRIPSSFRMYEDLPDADKAHVSLDVMKAITESSLLSHEVLSYKYFEDSERVTRRFMKEAREFDSMLSENDIYQASRNLWVFNSIQMILGQEIELTRSSFAYSLLYPYTDNGLDSSAQTSDEKHAYIHWLSQWFERENWQPLDDWTGKTAKLLQMIEKEYPRPQFCDVYLSLRAIHQAQIKSLLLHNITSNYDEESLTAITIEKGGTSVLADGFLAAGRLNIAEADSFFEYGVLLQLLDDLCDFDEDKINAHSNPFLRIAERDELDSVTRRLLLFVKRCAGNLASLKRFHGPQIREMVEQSCSFLILEAAARHREFYSKNFLRKVECWMPLRSAFLRELHSEIEMRQAQSAVHVRLTHALGE